jgi:hypothetical protein
MGRRSSSDPGGTSLIGTRGSTWIVAMADGLSVVVGWKMQGTKSLGEVDVRLAGLRWIP